MKLRQYQRDAVTATMKAWDDSQRVLTVIPTGGGKTIYAGFLAKGFMELGRVMVVCHRDELIRQAADKFAAVTGVAPAIEKAGEWSDEESMHGKPQIVVASLQTLVSGRDRRRMERFNPNEFSFLWIDEAHHAAAQETWGDVIGYFCRNPSLKMLGVTATGDRGDGEKLQIFQKIAHEITLPHLIDDGYLVPIRQRSVTIGGLDFSKIRTTAGDLNAGDLEQAVMFEKPLHGMVHATMEVACGIPVGSLAAIKDSPDRQSQVLAMAGRRRKTLVFSPTVAHAERFAEILNRWIVGCATHIDGAMSPELRRERLADFSSGKIQFLVNCMIATEGFDEPGIELIGVARATKSRALFTQMIGRGIRPAANIADALGNLATSAERAGLIAGSSKPYIEILDFAGNNGRHELISTIDILGESFSDEVIRAARSKMDGTRSVSDVLTETKLELEKKKREAEEKRKKREQEAERRRIRDAAERASIVATAEYDISDGGPVPFDRGNDIDQWTLNTLQRAKVPRKVMETIPPDRARKLAREIKRRWKEKLCSYRQGEILMRAGFPKSSIATMTYEDASLHIASLSEGWKRKRAEVAA